VIQPDGSTSGPSPATAAPPLSAIPPAVAGGAGGSSTPHA